MDDERKRQLRELGYEVERMDEWGAEWTGKLRWTQEGECGEPTTSEEQAWEEADLDAIENWIDGMEQQALVGLVDELRGVKGVDELLKQIVRRSQE